MKIKPSKIFGGAVNGILIVLIFIMVIAVGWYLSTQLGKPQRQPNQSAGGGAPTPKIVDNESEQRVLDTIEEKIKKVLSDKNKWYKSNYSITVSHIDAKFVAGTITSDKDIPEGIFLLNTNPDNNYTVVFDSATESPCRKLRSTITYPDIITNFCNTSNQTTPTNAPDN